MQFSFNKKRDRAVYWKYSVFFLFWRPVFLDLTWLQAIA